MGYNYKTERLTCDSCGRFMRRPYDQRTVFGCADPEAPEPYDPEYFCKKCAAEMYKDLLRRYKCCYREGDWKKSNAEVRAAHEAGLTWIGSAMVNSLTGGSVYHKYASAWEMKYLIGYGEYEQRRRDENRCKCWRVKNEQGNCSRCNHHELHCLCIYDNGTRF